ncbi:MAG: Ig-like domain-containing protein [Acidimicrobiales bacterium]
MNDAPQILALNRTAIIGRPIPLAVSVTDPDTAAERLTVGATAAHGSVSGAYPELTYTPGPGFRGDDTVTVTASDGLVTSSAEVVVRVVTVIDNGVVQLGINPTGELNVDSGDLLPSLNGTSAVGLRYLPTTAEATAPGCLCEGWGVADATSGVTGYANQSKGTANITPVSMTVTSSTATVVVRVGDTFLVTHRYRPSTATPNLYEDEVTIENISAAPTEVRYRRVMDWDVEPTAFTEYVTIVKGDSPELVFTSDDGFATSDPLGGPSSIRFTGAAADDGPIDHGALFDFAFGALAPGASRTFVTFYGAAGNEAAALAALRAVGAEAYSLGQPSTPGGADLGEPNTFVFAFGRVGGTPVFNRPPVANAGAATTPAGAPTPVLLSGSDPDGDPLTFAVASGPAHGVLSGTAPALVYTPDAGFSGEDTFTFTAFDGEVLSAPATVRLTVRPAAPPNRPPVLGDDAYTVAEDAALMVPAPGVLTNDSDPDGDALAITVWGAAAHGTVVGGPGGSVTYNPAADFHGADAFTYTASDGHGHTATATVRVTVTPVNDPPQVTASIPASGVEGTPIAVSAAGADADADALTFTWSVSGGPCTLTPVTGTAASLVCTDDAAAALVTVTASDGHAATPLTREVTTRNAPPSVAVRPIAAGGTAPAPVTVEAVVSDPARPTCCAVPSTSATARRPTRCSRPGASAPQRRRCWPRATLTVTDDDGGVASGFGDFLLRQANRPPTVTLSGPASGAEGAPLAVSATVADLDRDFVAVLWTMTASGLDAGGVCTLSATNGLSTSVRCTDDATVTLTALAGDGQSSTSATTTILVGDAVPSIALAPVAISGPAPAEVTVTAGVSDPGANDVLFCRFAFSDGAVRIADAASGVCRATVPGLGAGSFRVTVTVTDDDHESATASSEFTVAAPPPPSSCTTVSGEASLAGKPWRLEVEKGRGGARRVEVYGPRRQHWHGRVASTTGVDTTATLTTAPSKEGTVLTIVIEDRHKADRFSVKVTRRGRVLASTDGLQKTSRSTLRVDLSACHACPWEPHEGHEGHEGHDGHEHWARPHD